MDDPPSTSRTTTDPSSVPNLFAQRLTEALANQPLSLSRVRNRLEAGGLKVSVATLSYWSTGHTRPGRGQSLAVVTALESLLGVPAGWFTQALDAERTPADIARIAPLEPEAAEVLTGHGLTARSLWERVMIHYTVQIAPDGREDFAETRQVSRAEAEGLSSWATFVFTDSGDAPRFEALQGVEIREDSTVRAPGAHAVQLVLPAPVHKGECVLTAHRVHFDESAAVARRCGYVVNRTTDLLILEVVFAGEAPSQVQRWFRTADAEQGTPLGAPIEVRQGRATCVLTAATPGHHTLEW